MKSDRVLFQHILDAIAQIEQYLTNKSFDEFGESRLLQDGVIRELAIIGEAARRVSLSMKERYPDIPWADIIGMRNILIHEYFEVDIAEAWETTRVDLPALKERILRIEEREQRRLEGDGA